jgi:predicted O-methyltransferase YrrM
MNFNIAHTYAELHSTPVSNCLQHLDRQTHLRTTEPHMLSGALQGQLLTVLCKMVSAKTILDIGTFTGYSAICMADGMTPDGTVFTIDRDEEKADFVLSNIIEAGYANKILPHVGDALTIIPTLNATFDVVYIDADKENYAAYFDLVIDKMNKGGLIIADNILWKGKVFEEKKDKKTTLIDAFNKKINEDERIENILLPIRDGLMLMRIK